MALALDASTPAYASGSTDPWVTASFTPPNSALLVCVVTGDWFGGTPAFTITDSQGVLSTANGRWTSVARAGSLNNGCVEIFTCQMSGSEGGVSRTISVDTNLASNPGGQKVYVLTGATTYTPVDVVVTASGGFADPTNVNVTTTRNDTLVLGGVVGWDGDGAITSSDTYENFNIGGTLEVATIRKASITATPTTETVNINPAAAEAGGCYAFVGITSTDGPHYPTIPSVGNGRLAFTNQLNTTATRTFPNFSSVVANAGDLLIAVVVAYQTSTGTDAAFSGWSHSFTEFHDTATSTTLAMGAAYKWADGTESGTLTVTQAGTITGDCSMILMSIPGAHPSTPPEAGSRASGTTAAADPASFNPSGWDNEDTLWISVVGSGMTSGTGSWTATGTTAPTNYTSRVDTNASDTSTVGDTEAAVAFRQLTAASEDVGTAGVDLTNARNGAFVIAVRPAPAETGTNADAEVANVTTAANQAHGNVNATADVANVGATANQPTVTTGKNVAAENAAVAAAAGQPHGNVSPSSGVANVSTAANAPSRAVQASSGLASAAVTAQQTTGRVSSTPATAQASTGALTPSTRVSPSSGVANVGATANQPTIVTGVNAAAGVANVGAAANPSTSTVSPVPSPADVGAAANQPSVSTSGSHNADAGGAGVTATANDAGGSVRASAGVASAGATANAPSRAVTASPGSAGATAAGLGATGRVAPVSQVADVGTVANQPTPVVGTFASAGVANVGTAANQASGLVSLSAGVAGVAASSSSSPSVLLHAGLAGVAAAAPQARGSVEPIPAPAAVTASAPSTSQRVLVGVGVAAAGAVAGNVTMGVPDVLALSESTDAGPAVGSSPTVSSAVGSAGSVSGPTSSPGVTARNRSSPGVGETT